MDNPSTILIVDDDRDIRSLLADYLEANGYRALAAADGNAMWKILDESRPDLIVLDLNLPGDDGLTLCRKLRAHSTMPVIMLTARSEPLDRILGLEMGADDYLPKPFEPRELLARLRAILRRKAAPATADVRRFGRLEIDRAGRRVTVDGEERALTSYQFALLDALADHAGRVMSRDALMDLTKGETLEAFDRSVDVHISRIRAAIEDDVKKPRRIITVRGAGYVFAKEQDR